MREIPLSRGLVTRVDDDDFDRFGSLKWCLKTARNKFYAVRTIKHKGVKRCYHLHRLIMGLNHGDDMEVDHIDGDGLNNQKSNLRICTSSQNARNKAAKHRKTGRYRWDYDRRCK